MSDVTSTAHASQKTASELPPLPLPEGVSSLYVDTTSSCGLVFHYLSAGYDKSTRKPLLILLHGFPELAYSFKDLLIPLAEQGYHVVAVDQRGYGRTTGWDTRPFASADLSEFEISNLVRDLVCFVYALGYTEVAALISHDFGTVPGSWAPLFRPDIFKASVQLSIPFPAPPSPAFNVTQHSTTPSSLTFPAWPFGKLERGLESLNPPKKHYQWANSQPDAAEMWMGGSLGLKEFFRGYWFLKSKDYPHNHPHKLESYTADQLSKMSDYYVLPYNESMPDVVKSMMKGYDVSVSKAWFPDADLDVLVSEFQRTGFQGSLNWYRVVTSPPSPHTRDGLLMAGRKITVPTAYIGGAQDWGNYQIPGALEGYNVNCTDFRGATIIDHAGHWLYAEQLDETLDALKKFLKSL